VAIGSSSDGVTGGGKIIFSFHLFNQLGSFASTFCRPSMTIGSSSDGVMGGGKNSKVSAGNGISKRKDGKHSDVSFPDPRGANSFRFSCISLLLRRGGQPLLGRIFLSAGRAWREGLLVEPPNLGWRRLGQSQVQFFDARFQVAG
jgi:hypothetical protein